jgi:hypothetical protein
LLYAYVNSSCLRYIYATSLKKIQAIGQGMYVGVVWFVSRALQFLPIDFYAHNANLCCIYQLDDEAYASAKIGLNIGPPMI